MREPTACPQSPEVKLLVSRERREGDRHVFVYSLPNFRSRAKSTRCRGMIDDSLCVSRARGRAPSRRSSFDDLRAGEIIR